MSPTRRKATQRTTAQVKMVTDPRVVAEKVVDAALPDATDSVAPVVAVLAVPSALAT
jgi:hypothetical protein